MYFWKDLSRLLNQLSLVLIAEKDLNDEKNGFL